MPDPHQGEVQPRDRNEVESREWLEHPLQFSDVLVHLRFVLEGQMPGEVPSSGPPTGPPPPVIFKHSRIPVAIAHQLCTPRFVPLVAHVTLIGSIPRDDPVAALLYAGPPHRAGRPLADAVLRRTQRPVAQ